MLEVYFLSLHMIHIWTYQSPIILQQLFSEHFADSNLIHLQVVKLYYTQRGIVVRSTFSLCLLLLKSVFFRGKIRSALFSWVQCKAHGICLKWDWKGTLLLKKKRANFSVTHWVTESLQAQWPALVKNILCIYIKCISQSQQIKKRYNTEKFYSISMCAYF